MTVKRIFWAAVSPVVWALHRVGLCSYKWVNVCIGARHPQSFDALWQHRWYGAAIPSLPDEVVLCGILYATAVAEGTVTFFESFAKTRITFDRDPYDTQAQLWYVTIASATIIPASHVRAAYEWTCAVFGGSFEFRQIAKSPSDPREDR